MTLEIRSALIEDVKGVHALYKSTESTLNEPEGARYSIEELTDYVNSPHPFLVCIEDKQIVGFLLGFDLVCWVYVDVLIVARSHERKGIGSLLIARLITMERSWKRVEMSFYLNDLGVMSFLKRNGFEFNDQATTWVSRDISRVPLHCNAFDKKDPGIWCESTR